MILNKPAASLRGQQASNNNIMAALNDRATLAKAEAKSTRPNGIDPRIAFVFSLAKKRQKQRVSGI